MIVLLMCFSLLLGPFIGIELMKTDDPIKKFLGIISLVGGLLFCAMLD